jgi:hypothetical protein
LDVMATDLRDSLLAVSDDSRSSHRYQRIDGIQVPSSSLTSAMSKGKFNVDLDNPSAVYLPGQVVNGRVLLHLDTAETVRGELHFSFYDRHTQLTLLTMSQPSASNVSAKVKFNGPNPSRWAVIHAPSTTRPARITSNSPFCSLAAAVS